MPKYKLKEPWWDNVKMHQAGDIVEIEEGVDLPDGAVAVGPDEAPTPQPEPDPTAGPRGDRRVAATPASDQSGDDDGVVENKPRSATRRKK
jgi:hypothetical protein